MSENGSDNCAAASPPEKSSEWIKDDMQDTIKDGSSLLSA